MRYRKAFVVSALMIVASSACSDDRVTASPSACLANEGESAPGYVGLTRADAEAKATASGLDVRVVGENGNCFDRQSDFNADRVNVFLVDGKVAAARRF